MNKYYYYATRISRAISDLLESKDYLSSWLEKDTILVGVNDYHKKAIENALLLSAFISYDRVFTQSFTEQDDYHEYVSKEFKKLRKTTIDKFSEEKLNMHNLVHKERSNSFAHSDGKSAGVSLVAGNIFSGSIMRNPYGGYTFKDIQILKEMTEQLYDDFKNKQREIFNKYPESFK